MYGESMNSVEEQHKTEPNQYSEKLEAHGQLGCPLSLALSKGNKKMIRLLREYGATAEKTIYAAEYWKLLQ